ncbi:16S rRNA (uracil1498-N3)-methyltransferase [Pelagirhabdus alkalitolerans]|uniref:Ribosomal RNA small subunit methyltransferase E n=1 Tax=Pelagirhabdus alkalitolerans TaxID=1612202 RepID=A0A1G6HWA7_9BACI|nr:16S rRNA (uracil(1498)-N(3))-methyltransferase [Pelagirhabdus alkalitolerans]SDB98115.1 16S rRNA (uracil1498-N3)-methyltransferase [Pelagirhabdus alkalitolerans]
MQRYFIDPTSWNEDTVVISGNDAHHIKNVMRMSEGESVICVNVKAQVTAECCITNIKDDVTLTVLNYQNEAVELPVHVTIAQGLPKGEKLESIVQKSTELGVDRIVPFEADRSIVKWDYKKKKKKQDRLVKISKEAAEQSHRSYLPTISPVTSFSDVLAILDDYDHVLVAHEDTTRQIEAKRLSYYFSLFKPDDKIMCVIGPEGGISEGEIEALQEAKVKPIRLGRRILRTETAALYFLSALSYHLEEQE